MKTIGFILFLFASPLAAQHSAHADHNMGDTRLLSEPGQAGFAALSEVVQRLMADRGTDWSEVDVAALRRHLVDMDRLVNMVEAEMTEIDKGAEFRVALSGPAGETAGRMIPAHAPVLAAETGWTSVVSPEGDALVWSVTSDTDADMIRALGFHGLMAVGDHHREHHWAIATGGNPHAH